MCMLKLLNCKNTKTIFCNNRLQTADLDNVNIRVISNIRKLYINNKTMRMQITIHTYEMYDLLEIIYEMKISYSKYVYRMYTS